MIVVVTDAAYDDLLGIGRVIRADNPLRAASVEILRILHGARDYEAVLFPDE